MVVRDTSYSWESKECPTERYIIIGNGFDIESGLPTRYTDFLEEIERTGEVKKAIEKEARIRNHLYQKWMNNGAKEVELYEKVLENYWYHHIVEAKERLGGGWVDFENEIAQVVNAIEALMDFNKHTDKPFWSLPVRINPKDKDFEKIADIIRLYQSHRWKNANTTVSYQLLFEELNNDLIDLTNALGAYLRFYSYYKQPNVTSSVNTIIDAICTCKKASIVSFNYTNTLEYLVKEKKIHADFYYIHGKLSNDDNFMHIVLGIDDAHTDSGSQMGGLFDTFRKSSQRLTKGTEAKYKLLKKRLSKKNNRRKEAIILGHSLSKTDEDVITEFLVKDYMRVRIYYYDAKHKEDIITNLRSYHVWNRIEEYIAEDEKCRIQLARQP